jgi:hypothetical protein
MVTPDRSSEPEQEAAEAATPFSRRLGHAVERAALRAERVAGRVNFGASATVLVWLLTTVATAQVLPWWEAVSLGFIALGAGVLLGSRLGFLAASGVVGVVILACGAAWVVAHVDTDPAKARASAPPVAVVGGLRASLELKNETYKNVWGQTIAADGNDELLFRLRISNPGSTPSQQMVMRLLSKEGNESPRTVDVCFGRSEEANFEAGPEVKIVPQSNGLETFVPEEPQFGYPAPAATRLASLGGRQFRANSRLYVGEDYIVPAISAGKSILITFKASYWTPPSDQLSGGSIFSFKNLTRHEDEYRSVAAAGAGDVLQAYATLNDTGFRSTSAFTRVRITEHEHGAFAWVALIVQADSPHERELGHGVVNAETESPISMTVIPRTTEIRTPTTDCSKETREPVADGISKGGLEVTGIGGFKPRDPCHGIEFSKYVFFKLKVH